MDYTPTNPKPNSPSDYSGVNQAASDLRGHSSEAISDFAATQAQTVKSAAGDVKSAAMESANYAKDVAVEKAQNFRAYAGDKASAIKQEAGVKIKQGAAKAKEIHVTAEDYVRDHPTKSILSAVGVGVIIGLIMRR